jgi:hypothetical protein
VYSSNWAVLVVYEINEMLVQNLVVLEIAQKLFCKTGLLSFSENKCQQNYDDDSHH